MHQFKDLVKEYQAKGYGSEKKMWESIEILNGPMMFLCEKHPEMYDETMRDLHEAFCGPHYNEYFAKRDVECMHHKGKSGEEKGEHWNINQVEGAIKGMTISGNANKWDAYVALNANWHDKELKFREWFGDDAEKRVIEDAVLFYFHDDDAPEGKVWEYMDAMKKK